MHGMFDFSVDKSTLYGCVCVCFSVCVFVRVSEWVNELARREGGCKEGVFVSFLDWLGFIPHVPCIFVYMLLHVCFRTCVCERLCICRNMYIWAYKSTDSIPIWLSPWAIPIEPSIIILVMDRYYRQIFAGFFNYFFFPRHDLPTLQ